MPVLLQAQDVSNDSRVITLSEYEEGRKNFTAHYFLSGCNSLFGGQDIAVPWVDFNDAVEKFIKEYTLDAASVALRFVYAFDEDTTSLKLRLQLCTMAQSKAATNTFILEDDQCDWYELVEGKMATANDKSLHDPAYLGNFYYCEADACDEKTAQNLADDEPDTLYARTITFPWEAEVLQMYTDNALPGNGKICFGACSYVNGGDGNAPILYPHGMVIYLEDADGKPLLDDDDEIVVFHNKGCDMGTLCPSLCNVYISPGSF